jgi:uncharacterized protein (DUF488 family)
MTLPFFTIGHSNLSSDAFIARLCESQVEHVVDIRKIPKSRTNPQFNQDTLPGALASFGISYEHEAALGGLRGKARNEPMEVNGWWENKSFHNYADYALTAPFRAGLAHLREGGRQRRCVVMCAEAVWWRCHRRIVADYLIARGETVFHIMGSGRQEVARLTPGAVLRPDETIVYPAADR